MPTPPPNSLHPKTCAEWRKWPEQNHTRDEGVWLISYKKASGKGCFDYDEAVDDALASSEAAVLRLG